VVFYIVVIAMMVRLIITLVRRRKIPTQTITSVKFLLLCGVALVPAMITTDAPHATRSLLFFVLIVGLAWYGVGVLSYTIPTKTWRVMIAGWLAWVVVSGGGYVWHYFTAFPNQQERFYTPIVRGFRYLDWQSEERIIIAADNAAYNYILAAWYTRLPAAVFLETIVRSLPTIAGLYAGERLANMVFLVADDYGLDIDQVNETNADAVSENNLSETNDL
jgi:hypothetical protein